MQEGGRNLGWAVRPLRELGFLSVVSGWSWTLWDMGSRCMFRSRNSHGKNSSTGGYNEEALRAIVRICKFGISVLVVSYYDPPHR